MKEFVRRAGLALPASPARQGGDGKLPLLPLVEQVADDERNFVKKAASWALRSMARRSAALKAKVIVLAKRFAASQKKAARWIGKDVLRQLRAGIDA